MPLNPAVDGTGPAGKKFAGPRKGLHPRSWQLSTRLVAVMLALLTVICALVGFVSYTTLSLTINTQLDTSLQQATVRTIAFYTSPTPNGSQPEVGS